MLDAGAVARQGRGVTAGKAVGLKEEAAVGLTGPDCATQVQTV